ncbi:hypothetical protein DL96DRAFT_1639525 [Flagelloscypha sp. PMI_526]|nr:hypothetical protein DL96DRAFT_1639525 [Flagelloscypha sp. PMI_526]
MVPIATFITSVVPFRASFGAETMPQDKQLCPDEPLAQKSSSPQHIGDRHRACDQPLGRLMPYFEYIVNNHVRGNLIEHVDNYRNVDRKLEYENEIIAQMKRPCRGRK